MPAIGCADDSVDVASQRSGPRTAAKSKAGPSQRVEDSAMRIVKEEDKEADDIPLEDATFERLKQRRHMRGANTSDVDFAHLFNSLAKMNDCFQQEPAEEIDTSDTILHKENQFLAACVNACLTFEGQQRKEKNREEHADEEQEDEVEDDEEKEQKAQWCAAREAVMDVAFSKKKIFFPEALLTSLKAKDGPNVSREGLLDGLLNMKYLQRLPGSKKADTRYIPVLTAEVSLCDILHHQDRICELELSEMYNIDKFSNYLTQHPHRAANSKILADVLQASSESRRPRAGRPSPEEVKQKEDMQARSRKLRSAETHGEELLEALTEPIQKKRRFSQKKPEVKTENSEDHILIRKVNYQYPGPCTIRTRKQVGISIEEVCKQSASYILDKTGFKVTIREKRHETVNALIKKAAACAKRAPFPTDHVYCVPGNCIPHALASLGAITEEKVSLLTEACPDNAYMQQRGCRTYLQCSNMFHCSFSPVLCTQSFDFRGNFLLHSENGGSPHCVAVKQDEEDKLIVFDTDGVFHLAVADFETALLGGVDAATCVIFKLQDGKKDTDVGMSDFDNLLDLAAGSSESNEECTTDDAQDTALLPEVSEKKGSFDWLDDTGRVITDQVLLSDLQTEAQKFMEAAKAAVPATLAGYGGAPSLAVPEASSWRDDRLGCCAGYADLITSRQRTLGSMDLAAQDICTEATCPTMSAGSFAWQWADGDNRELARERLLSLPNELAQTDVHVESQLADEPGTFLPVQKGQPRGSGPTCDCQGIRVIYKRLFRIYAHIFHAHFKGEVMQNMASSRALPGVLTPQTSTVLEGFGRWMSELGALAVRLAEMVDSDADAHLLEPMGDLIRLLMRKREAEASAGASQMGRLARMMQ
ncbi:MOB kinase activator 1A (Mob1 alpha) (Mob1A) (Mob1 homolog 1B) (Mps one binder kinase activator-like 1B) [Durusdinium trenchii]|uniref:MOB kinase activator 1A (Mob1 alpha) (Mob1A) (Mob1 homolog 1B) (Mps one binder kinase activator-like 1B) n=1 Tax=Durusdinium trenchii TaxID=1381693 RepID=A0ABP0H7W3_9DINO